MAVEITTPQQPFMFNETLAMKIPSGAVELDGLFYMPKDARGLVLFVHGSGSSRLSRRNQHVATILNDAGLATVLFDLLTPEEEVIDNQTRQLRFNIEFLASRLINATNWCRIQPILQALSIGYFGASTGAAAALVAAATEPVGIAAIVSRGGRPDLAGEVLDFVQAPTLLIVGEADQGVMQFNREAFQKLNCTKNIESIPHATHLFEEPGALDEVARLAKKWFIHYLLG